MDFEVVVQTAATGKDNRKGEIFWVFFPVLGNSRSTGWNPTGCWRCKLGLLEVQAPSPYLRAEGTCKGSIFELVLMVLGRSLDFCGKSKQSSKPARFSKPGRVVVSLQAPGLFVKSR